MMAQHTLTRPVFEALFEHYDFSAGNPVAQALDSLGQDFGEFGLENETRDLERFYESVRMRARGLDNSEARQHVLMELYEKFFSTALKKERHRSHQAAFEICYMGCKITDLSQGWSDSKFPFQFATRGGLPAFRESAFVC